MRELRFRVYSGAGMIDLKSTTPLALGKGFNLDCIYTPFHKEYHIMQFTCLKDENGKEVYEGDIIVNVHSEVDNNKYVVIHNLSEIHSEFCLKLPNTPCVFPFSSMRGIEVIGNIYENPELLS